MCSEKQAVCIGVAATSRSDIRKSNEADNEISIHLSATQDKLQNNATYP